MLKMGQNIDVVFLDMMKLLKAELVPYKTNLTKFRLGDEDDGSYPICDIPSDGLYSYGSNDQTEFERAFYKKYEKPCWVYDHTINGITNKPDFIHFFKQGVSHETTYNMDTIDNQIAANGHTDCSNMFAQIDVEGWEWTVIKKSEKIKEFAQVIIECHLNGGGVTGNPAYVLQNFEKIIETLRFMNEHFVCVHIHGNNSPAISPWLDYNLPCVLECTYVRKDLVTHKEVDTQPYPIPGLDFPNNPTRPDMPLTWWVNA